MEFSLDGFVASPSWEGLDKCKKADLLIVANCYDVQVSYSARKAELKRILCEELVERGVLPKLSGDTAAEAPVAEVRAAEAAGMRAASVEPGLVTGSFVEKMTTEDLRLALQIKEVETKNNSLKCKQCISVSGLLSWRGKPPLPPPRCLLTRVLFRLRLLTLVSTLH